MSDFETIPDILEVTLRDGSYLIDFQFTAEDTSTIAASLESVGFRWIEVGHGLGLNASQAGKGLAAASDEEYLEATAGALKRAKWGMFFIPGIGREEDIRLAAKYNMSFLRIGTNVTEAAQAEPYIALAKDLGMIVSYNGMKSYAVSPEEFGKLVAQVHGWGADIACLVDSAGSMDPDTVAAYLRAAKMESASPLGYHGHDNLSLAMANTLRAIEEGAVLVDSSLQGMGRSAGNAVTEVLVAILQRRGLMPHIDLKAAMDVGQGLIQPLLGKRGIDPMAVTGGLARFHSSFTGKVQRYANKHDIDVRDLIVRLCQEDQVSAPDELLEKLSHELATLKMPRVLSIPVFRIESSKDKTPADALELLLRELRARAVKSGKFSAVNVVTGEKVVAEFVVSGNIHSTQSHVVGSVELSSDDQLRAVLNLAEGRADVVLLDVDRKPFGPANAAETARAILKQTALLTYLDSRVWVEAVEDQVVRLLQEQLNDVQIVIAGDHPRSRFLALRLAERGAQIALLADPEQTREAESLNHIRSLSLEGADLNLTLMKADAGCAFDALSTARVVVVWPAEEVWFGKRFAHRVSKDAYVCDAGIGSITPDGMAEAQLRGCLLLRVNIWPALTGCLAAAHESLLETSEALGWKILVGVPVVAGGAMGQSGDVIVDSVRHPSRVIGVCDGRGGVRFRFSAEDTERVRRVQTEINRRLVTPQMSGSAASSVGTSVSMNSKRILILGGGRYNVPSIRAARAAGFTTFVADRNSDAPGLKVADHPLAVDLNDCDSLVRAITEQGGVDGVLSMAEAGVRAAANISARLGLPSISEQAAANATSKAAMRRLWKDLDYSTDFEVVATPDDAQRAVQRLGKFPLIFKPDRSLGGSRGVTRVERVEEAADAFSAAKAGGLPDSDVVIEHCVEGSEHSAELLIWRGETSVLCIGQKIKSLFPYRVDVSVQYPAQLTAAQESAVADMCRQAVRALGLTQGAAHIEFAYTARGPVLFELGARCGGGHTPQIAHHVSGVEEFVEACRMACGLAPSQLVPVSRRGADYRFLIFSPGVVKQVRIANALAHDAHILDSGVTVKGGDTILPLHSTSDRAGFLVATGETLEEAAAHADRGCREVSTEYADGSIRHAAELIEFRELAHS